MPGVLRQRSEVVLWKLLSIQIMFDELVGEIVVSLSYSSAILGPPLHCIFCDLWTLDSGLTNVRDRTVGMNVPSW